MLANEAVSNFCRVLVLSNFYRVLPESAAALSAAAPAAVGANRLVSASHEGQANTARHVMQRNVNPRFFTLFLKLNDMHCDDAASNIWQDLPHTRAA